MKTNHFKRIQLGRCLNEYQHPLYGELIKECVGYIVTNEMTNNPQGTIIDKPTCGTNQYCYGVLKEAGVVVLLRYVVDSSD